MDEHNISVIKKLTSSAEAAKVVVQDATKESFSFVVGNERTWLHTVRMLFQWIAIGFCLAHIAQSKPTLIGGIINTVTAVVFPLQYAACLGGWGIYNNWLIEFINY